VQLKKRLAKQRFHLFTARQRHGQTEGGASTVKYPPIVVLTQGFHRPKDIPRIDSGLLRSVSEGSAAMRKSETYFEQIPVNKVKDIMATLDNQEIQSRDREGVHPILRCRICSEPVPVEAAKTDDCGQAIHEACYMTSLNRKPVGFRTRQTLPARKSTA
jgi:hypothetical protein